MSSINSNPIKHSGFEEKHALPKKPQGLLTLMNEISVLVQDLSHVLKRDSNTKTNKEREKLSKLNKDSSAAYDQKGSIAWKTGAAAVGLQAAATAFQIQNVILPQLSQLISPVAKAMSDNSSMIAQQWSAETEGQIAKLSSQIQVLQNDLANSSQSDNQKLNEEVQRLAAAIASLYQQMGR